MGQGRIRTSYPITWTVSNIDRSHRNQPMFKNMMCYAPRPPPKAKLRGSSKLKQQCKRLVRYLALQEALKQFEKYSSKPFKLTFRSKSGGSKSVWFVVRPLLFVGDHPEVQLLSGFYCSAQATCPCNRCMISAAEIWSTAKSCAPPRNHTTISVMRWIALNDASVEMRKRAEKWLHQASTNAEYPLMAEIPNSVEQS
jgi:hypothetical protein